MMDHGLDLALIGNGRTAALVNPTGQLLWWCFPRFVSTVTALENELLREKHVMRYTAADDFGLPASAFLICRFWLVDAWWSLGRREEARDLFVDALAHRNRYGLLSEDIDPQTGALWGNFPQTYSMAGLILSAMRLSRSWEDRYWRG
jgi:GH15 family glucan-1,4-alpha-glucosidase